MECKCSGGRVLDSMGGEAGTIATLGSKLRVALVQASPPIESVCCVLEQNTLFAA